MGDMDGVRKCMTEGGPLSRSDLLGGMRDGVRCASTFALPMDTSAIGSIDADDGMPCAEASARSWRRRSLNKIDGPLVRRDWNGQDGCAVVPAAGSCGGARAGVKGKVDEEGVGATGGIAGDELVSRKLGSRSRCGVSPPDINGAFAGCIVDRVIAGGLLEVVREVCRLFPHVSSTTGARQVNAPVQN